MPDLSSLNWVQLSDLTWESRRLLETRWPDHWSYCPHRAARIIQSLSIVWKSVPGWRPVTVLEIGAGSFQPLAHGLIFYLNGASTTIAMDVAAQLHSPEQAARACYELLLHAIAFPERYSLPGSNPETIRQRAYLLPLDALQKGDWNALLACQAGGFAYVGLEAAESLLPAGQFDFIFSNAVLEHVHEPQAALDWHRRLLKPGGLAFHLIGLDDHRHYEDPENFTAWTFMVDGQYGTASTIRPDLWINGLRASQWRAMIDASGYECLAWEEVEAYPTPQDIMLRVNPEFRSLPESDLRNFRLSFVLRKPVSAPVVKPSVTPVVSPATHPVVAPVMTPGDAQAIYEKALAAYRAKSYSETARLLQPLLAAVPDDISALSLRSALAYDMGDLAGALSWQEKLAQLSPGKASYWFNIGQILIALERGKEAIRALEKGFGLRFSNWRGYGKSIPEALAVKLLHEPNDLVEIFPDLGRYAGLLRGEPDYKTIRQAMLTRLKALAVPKISPDQQVVAWQAVNLVLDLLAFFKESPLAWNREVVQQICQPLLEQALQQASYDFALSLEFHLDMQYVHQVETEAHFAAHHRSLSPSLLAAARLLRRGLPDLPGSDRNVGKVGILIHNLDSFGPNEVTLNLLRSLGPTVAASFSVYVIGLYLDQSSRRIWEATGARVVYLPEVFPHLSGQFASLLLELRKILIADCVTTLVWATTAANMFFAFGLRLAPVQVWWSMKYHSLEFDEIDGYLALGSIEAFKRIGDRNWRSVHGALAGLFEPALSDEAKHLRKQFPVRQLLGCMGREAKFDSPEYLDAIIAILQARPDVGFLWTGLNQLERVQGCFEQAGVAARCFFVGWVNTRLFAQVLDICADTFPFGGGITVFESMAAGKPVVFQMSPEAMESGVPMTILPLLNGDVGTEVQQQQARKIWTGANGENLFLCADSSEQYVAYALRLIDDNDFAHLSGQAGKNFVETFISDTRLMTDQFMQHMHALHTERLAACRT